MHFQGEEKMTTTKLYQQDVYIKAWDAAVTRCEQNDKGNILVWLDRTAFFPEGGGQSCDQGTMVLDASGSSVAFAVADVQEDGDDVVHTLEALPDGDKPVSGSDAKTAEDAFVLFSSGATVHCTLDWDRRFDNMQRHCGEHILSGIFYQECGAVNRGFHMGEDYMTIDMSLEDEPTNPDATRPEQIDFEMAQHCELLANKVIWSNAPVTVFRFDTREEAEKMPLRKKLAFDEDISIVCVGSVENAADCVACCGTHPATAGQVGLLKIFKVENYKGMFRIYFEAGERALKDYDLKHNILTDLSNRYSSSIEDFPSKIKGLEEKMAASKDELYHLKKAFIEGECAKLNAQLAEESESPVVVWPLDLLSMDDTFNMAKSYMGKPDCCGKLILLYSKKSTSYILVSDGAINCGALVKEYASFYNGKGGGNNVSARAIFTNDDDAALFADLLSKHLR